MDTPAASGNRRHPTAFRTTYNVISTNINDNIIPPKHDIRIRGHTTSISEHVGAVGAGGDYKGNHVAPARARWGRAPRFLPAGRAEGSSTPPGKCGNPPSTGPCRSQTPPASPEEKKRRQNHDNIMKEGTQEQIMTTTVRLTLH